MKNQMEPTYWYMGNLYIQIKKENECLLFKKDKTFKRKLIVHCVSKDVYQTFEEYLIAKYNVSDIDINNPSIKENIIKDFRWIGNKIYLQINVKPRK